MSYQQKWYVNAPVNRAKSLIINDKMLPLNQEQKIKNKNKFLGMHSRLRLAQTAPPGTPGTGSIFASPEPSQYVTI